MFSQLDLFKMSCFFSHLFGPCQLFLRPVAGIKFEMSSLVDKSAKFSSLKLVMLSMFCCDKILGHVIWKSFSFHFMKIKKTFQNLRCKSSLIWWHPWCCNWVDDSVGPKPISTSSFYFFIIWVNDGFKLSLWFMVNSKALFCLRMCN